MKIGEIGYKTTLSAAIEACADSKEPLLFQQTEQGIEIVNVNEIKRSPFDPEPYRFTNPYEKLLPLKSNVIKGQFKKKRKNNNRKKSKRRK